MYDSQPTKGLRPEATQCDRVSTDYQRRRTVTRLSHLVASLKYLTRMLLKCCFTSTETVGLLGTGAQDGHLDFHTAPELSHTNANLFIYIYVCVCVWWPATTLSYCQVSHQI